MLHSPPTGSCSPHPKVVFIYLFIYFLQVLANHAKSVSEEPSEGKLLSAPKQEEKPLSDWELVRGYFGKLHVLLALLSLTIVLLHICFASPTLRATLIRWGLDLPDTMSELLFTAIVVLQVERVVKMTQQFVQARFWQSKLTVILTRTDLIIKFRCFFSQTVSFLH